MSLCFEKALEEAVYSTDIDFDFHGGARWAREWLDEQEHLKVSFEAITEIKKLRTENAKLRGAREWLQEDSSMKLAGVSTACLQNTEKTIKDRIDKSNPYWTVAYGDVCDTVDREMKLRTENAKLNKQLELTKAFLITFLDIYKVKGGYMNTDLDLLRERAKAILDRKGEV
jgi:hypothetical protein